MPTQSDQISLEKAYEVRYWTRVLNCSEGELYAAVLCVGKNIVALKKYRAAMSRSVLDNIDVKASRPH